jgi:hypothetical protein
VSAIIVVREPSLESLRGDQMCSESFETKNNDSGDSVQRDTTMLDSRVTGDTLR